MSRMTQFNSPFLLGFDQIERAIDRLQKTGDGYPPYNIEQMPDGSLRITLAVAGFGPDDLQVTVEDNQLVIRGRQKEDDRERAFLHRGIAARQFQRAFVLADGIEVTGADLSNGLLSVDLHRPQPQVTVKHIEISAGSANGKAGDAPLDGTLTVEKTESGGSDGGADDR
jgi:HSP20 family molecular chaperone IbpA